MTLPADGNIDGAAGPGVEITTADAIAASSAAPHSPVFIVGSARSGTSILVDGMLTAGYAGYREGHFLNLLPIFDRAADRHRATFGKPHQKVLAGRVDWDAFKDDIFQLFKRYVETSNPVSPWVDKSGGAGMIEAIPILQRLWPQARFIYAKRRAIENIVSRQKKFPRHEFEHHCAEWAQHMAAWRAVRGLLGNFGIEIDQQEIAQTPAVVAARLCQFLGAGAEARRRMQATFEHARPQQTEAGSAMRLINLDDLGWSPDQRATFERLCQPEMQMFNYSTTATYWAKEANAAANE